MGSVIYCNLTLIAAEKTKITLTALQSLYFKHTDYYLEANVIQLEFAFYE